MLDASAGGARPRPVAEGAFRIDSVMGLPRVLRDLGLDPAASIADVGLDPRIFQDPRNELSMASLGRLMASSAARSGCARVGLLVGCRSGLASVQPLGPVMRHAPDVVTALGLLAHHVALRDRAGVVVLHVSGGVASLGYEICQEVEGADQIAAGAMGMAVNIMRGLCGRAWRPSEVLFAHRAPADTDPYDRVFGARLQFDAGRNSLLFPAGLLERPTLGADAGLFRDQASWIRALDSRTPRDLEAEVRRTLLAILLTGRGSVEEVAERLGLHRRTLNRRLAARGTSVHRMVEATRFQIARQLLGNTAMPLGEIAATLGYADASAFTRAFRRWTGRPPSDWRRRSDPASDPGPPSEEAPAPRLD